MLVEQFRSLAKYNTWMNGKLYACCAQLDDATRKQEAGAFFGSIHGTLNHALLADKGWMMRFTGDEKRYSFRDDEGKPVRIRTLDQELHQDFEVLQRERKRLDEGIELWTLSLDEQTLQRELRWYSMSRKKEYAQPLWQAVLHCFNHQAHHRGQCSTLLTQVGQDLGVTDLGVFLAEDGHVKE
jgi:uncharacterized damage-inducible protein DinB